MKQIRTQLAIPILALFICGAWGSCQSVKEGNDPVLVNAEKATVIANDTFDTLFKIERDNEVQIKQYAPQVHKATEALRVNAPQALKSARNLTEAYRVSLNEYRSSPNKDNQTQLQLANAGLKIGLDVLSALVAEANTYSAQIRK